jgi:hypothetical protein
MLRGVPFYDPGVHLLRLLGPPCQSRALPLHLHRGLRLLAEEERWDCWRHHHTVAHCHHLADGKESGRLSVGMASGPSAAVGNLDLPEAGSFGLHTVVEGNDHHNHLVEEDMGSGSVAGQINIYQL